MMPIYRLRTTSRNLTVLFAFAVLLIQIPASSASAVAAQPALGAPKVNAASAILVEVPSGQVLWEQNPDARRPMASTTKMMTALLAVDRLAMDDVVTAGQSVTLLGGAGLGIVAGEKITVRQLLYAMMLRSANDAAVAIAEKAGGGITAFVQMMNEKATELEMKDTKYMNPHGLDQPGHFSSAGDLAKLGIELLKKPELAEIVATKSWNFDRLGRTESLVNRNKLLGAYRYATGIKTGHTDGSGYCLVSSAKKGELELVAVVLGVADEESAARHSRELLDYGFSLYAPKKLVAKGTIFKKLALPYGRKVNLMARKDLTLVVRQGVPVETKVKVKKVELPVIAGDTYGTVEVRIGEKAVGEIELISDRGADAITFGEWVAARFSSLFTSIARLFGG